LGFVHHRASRELQASHGLLTGYQSLGNHLSPAVQISTQLHSTLPKSTIVMTNTAHYLPVTLERETFARSELPLLSIFAQDFAYADGADHKLRAEHNKC
jgi:hypothetical protein